MLRLPTLREMAVENLTVSRMEPVGFVEEAASAGFGAVGLALASASPQALEHEIVGRPETIRAIGQALRRTGLRVLDIEAFILAPDASLERWQRILDVGAALGATHISAIGGPLGAGALSGPQRIDLFSQLCVLAAGFDMQVGLEFMRYRDIPTHADALALLDAAGRTNAGLIVDSLHLHRTGTPPAEVARIPAGSIAYAQLCDAGPGDPALEHLPHEARTGRLHLGDGAIDLPALLAALPEGTILAVETPVAAERAWPTADRLQQAAARTHAFLQRVAATS